MTDKEKLKKEGWIIINENLLEIENLNKSCTVNGHSAQCIIDKSLEKYKMNLENINGHEIINFLNNLSNGELDDSNMVYNSCVFVEQSLEHNEYKLIFNNSFNNWGTNQMIFENYLIITKDNININLNEPLDSDGTNSILENTLSEWLENHTFISNIEDLFEKELITIEDKIKELTFNNNKDLDNIINSLIKLKTYI